MSDDVLDALNDLDEEDIEEDDEEEGEEGEYVALENQEIDKIKNIIKVPDDERRTSNLMTIYEYTEAVGTRISQIENGSKIFTDYDGLYNNKQIAIKEMHDRKNPLIVRRVVKTDGNNIYEEHWKVREMILPNIEIDLPIAKKKYEICSKMAE